MQIFLNFSTPRVLQSENGREFTAEIIRKLPSLWSGFVLVNGRPRHSRNQGPVEKE